MRKIFRARNVFLALALIIVGIYAAFAYNMNYVCGPGEHLIQSGADAIKQAELRISENQFMPEVGPGYSDEKPHVADFSQANCCEVKKTMTLTGVILWKVSLEGETIGEPKKRHIGADMILSNCSVVFENSYMMAYPAK